MSSISDDRRMDTKAVPSTAPDGMGNGLFATTDISVGHDVLKIKSPFVAVLDTPRLEDTCSGCFGKRQIEGATKLRACTRCHIVRYCDKTCQAKDWKFAHSLECSIYQKLRPRVLPNNARAVLRIVLRQELRKYDGSELDMFLKLETHVREIRDTNKEQWERISLSAKAVKKFSGTDTREEIISSFFAKLDLNSFNLVTPLYDRIGLYLHPYAALINHSCQYNSVVGFDGDELFVKAIRPIKADEQIFISYVDTTNPYNTRHKELAERYYFDCQCQKCRRGVDSREDQFLPACINASALDAAEKKAKNLMASPSAGEEPSRAVDRIKSAIGVLRETSTWPITRQPYVSLRDELILSMFSANQFQSAFLQGVVRHIRIDPLIYPYDGHPIRQLHAWVLAKLATHISQGAGTELGDPLFQKFQPNLGLIIWALLAWLVDKEGESCIVPSFRGMIRATFNEVHGEFRSNGLDPAVMTSEVKEEWEKLEVLADEVLRTG